MADGNIVLTIDAETGEAEKRVISLEKKVEALQKQITDLGKMVSKGFGSVGSAVKSVESETGNLGKELQSVRARVDDVASQLHNGFHKGKTDVVAFNDALKDLQRDILKLQKMAKDQAKVTVRGFRNVSDEVKDVKKDIEAVTAKIDEVSESVEELEDNAKKTEGAFDAIQSAIATGFEQVKTKIADVKEGVGTLQGQFGYFGETAKGQLEQLDPGFQKMIKGFKGMTKGIKSTGQGFSGLNKIIATGGIGLLLTLLGSLVAYFKETDAGVKLFEKGMKILKIPMQIVGDLAEQIGGALVYAFTHPKEAIDGIGKSIVALKDYFLTLIDLAIKPFQIEFALVKTGILTAGVAIKEFFGQDASNLKAQLEESKERLSELVDEAKDNAQALAQPFVDGAKAIGEYGKGVYDTFKAQARLKEMTKENEKSATKLVVTTAKLNKEMNKQQRIIDDETASYGKRRDALDAQMKTAGELFEAEQKQMKAMEDQLELAISLAEKEEDRKDLQADLADAIADRLDHESQFLDQQKQYSDDRVQMAEDEARRVLDIEDMLADAKIDARRNTISAQMQSDLEDLERQKQADRRELVQLQASREQLAQLEAQYAQQEQNMRDEYAIELLEQEQDVQGMIRDIHAEARERELSAQHLFAREELEVQMQRDLQELDEMEATEEQKLALRQAYDDRLTEMIEIQGQEMAEQQREVDAMLLEAQSQRNMLAIDNMIMRQEEREALRRQLEFEERQRDLDLAEEQALIDLENLEATEAEKQRVRDHYANIRRGEAEKLARDLNDIELRLFQEQIGMAEDAGSRLLGAMMDANNRIEAETEAGAKAQFEKNKRLQKAQTVIAGSSAIIGQLAVPQDQLTGANFVKAGLVATEMATQLKTINAQQFDSGSFSSDTNLSADGEDVQITPVDLSFLQRENEVEAPLRAYVVNQEVQNAEMQQTLINNKVNLG